MKNGIGWSGVAAIGMLMLLPNSAEALPQIWKLVEAKYVTPAPEKAAAITAAKCNMCHIKGESKKERNVFGEDLHELLEADGFKKADAKTPEGEAKMVKALDEILKKRSKAGDDKSPTYGELLAADKLPVPDAGGEPADGKPMPKPVVAEPVDSVAEQEAIKMVEKIGGTVYPLAMNDDRKSVSFHLGGTALNDAGLSYVNSIGNLYELNLKGTQITDAGLAHLAGKKSLERLHLETTGVTDEGLKHLAGLENLHYLNLYGTAVTDAGLEHLAGLKNLKKLYLWQTKCTDAGVAKLKQKVPEVEVSLPKAEVAEAPKEAAK